MFSLNNSLFFKYKHLSIILSIFCHDRLSGHLGRYLKSLLTEIILIKCTLFYNKEVWGGGGY